MEKGLDIELIETIVEQKFCLVFGFDPSKGLDRNREFLAWGGDALSSVALRNELQIYFEIALPTTMLWNSPSSIADISRLIQETLSRCRVKGCSRKKVRLDRCLIHLPGGAIKRVVIQLQHFIKKIFKREIKKPSATQDDAVRLQPELDFLRYTDVLIIPPTKTQDICAIENCAGIPIHDGRCVLHLFGDVGTKTVIGLLSGFANTVSSKCKYGDCSQIVVSEGLCIFHLPAESAAKRAEVFLDTLNGLPNYEALCLKGVIFPRNFFWSGAANGKNKIKFEECIFGEGTRIIAESITFDSCQFLGRVHLHGAKIHVAGSKVEGLLSCMNFQSCSVLSSDLAGPGIFILDGDTPNITLHLLNIRPLATESAPIHIQNWHAEKPLLSGRIGHASVHVRFVGIRFHGFVFTNMMIESCTFIDCTWGAPDYGRLLVPEKGVQPDTLEQVYRDLRKACDRGGDKLNSTAAYMSELEMRRRRKAWASWEFLYWVSSNFGGSWVRPLAWSFGIWLAALLLGGLMIGDFPCSGCDTFCEYHIRNALFAPLPKAELPLLPTVISTISKTLTTTLLVLAGFAIRRRLQ